MPMSPVEKEIIEATKFKAPKGGYSDRQDYLAAVLKVMDRMTESAFDNLSDEAAKWFNVGVQATARKQEIDDFDGPSVQDADPEADAEADADAESETSDEEPAEDAEETADEVEHEESEAELAEHAAEAEAESEHEAEEAAEFTAKQKAKAKGKAPAKAAKPPAKGKAPAKAPAAAKAPAKAPAKAKPPSRYTDLTGEKDRYGIVKGTKTHEAILLYEKGASAKQLKDKLGGKFYNILGKLGAEGHKVEKLEGGVFKLTHKDDIKKKGVK